VQRVSVTGTARGKRSAYVQAGYGGYVAKLNVKLGQKIKEGDALMSISQTIDQPLSQIFPVRAPFTGVITQVLKNEGEWVANTRQDAVMRLDDLTETWVDANIPEIDIAKVTVGLEAIIRPNALVGRTYKGVVREISLSAKEAADRWERGKVEFPILIQVTDADDELKPGMSVSVDVVAAKAEKVLTLPHEFVHRGPEGYHVVDASDKQHPVETGLTNESLIEIKSGVSEGMEVKMIDFGQIGTGASGGGRRGRSSR